MPTGKAKERGPTRRDFLRIIAVPAAVLAVACRTHGSSVQQEAHSSVLRPCPDDPGLPEGGVQLHTVRAFVLPLGAGPGAMFRASQADVKEREP